MIEPLTPETLAELRRLLDELPDDVRDAFTQVGELDFTEAPPAAELWAKSLAALPALLDAAGRLAEVEAERDALAAKVERVRVLPAGPPSGGFYMISMREVRQALDGTEADHA